MPPTDRFVTSFAAEPPQDVLPYGRWASTLRAEFLRAVRDIDPEEDEDLGTPGEIKWFPDRTYSGRTYVPGVARTDTGFELLGYVSFVEGSGGAPADFEASVDYTTETVENNPDWRLDLNDEVIGSWRGEQGKTADMTLVWGVPIVPGGVVATAELANLAVDQCEIVDERFTLIAPDNYRGDYLDVKLWGKSGDLIADESLYVDDGEDDADGHDAGADGDGRARADGVDAAGSAPEPDAGA